MLFMQSLSARGASAPRVDRGHNFEAVLPDAQPVVPAPQAHLLNAGP